MTMQLRQVPQEGAMMDSLTQLRIDREALMVLRRLCENGSVLAVARDMDTAVVVREDGEGGSIRTAIVEREIAQALALKEWISCKTPDANDGRDKRETEAAWDLRQDMGGGSRYLVTESPLIGLSRRKDKDGERFLDRKQVDAGERIRQDFEISQITLSDPEAWRDATDQGYVDLPKAGQEARDRLTAALEELGPGLADVVLRCCCLLEGLELTEKKMGWSARSGKIVLRIALTRLIRHYHETQGKFGPMIG